ncbi:MAG: amidase family protein [Methylocella sp.]
MLDSAANLHAAPLSRGFSSLDLLCSILAAFERFDPAMNAIAQKDAASAWRATARADAHAARGRPLEGLPETIKDRFEVAGALISAGAPAL